eukprot:4252253-Prymnesium_polylepis.1
MSTHNLEFINTDHHNFFDKHGLALGYNDHELPGMQRVVEWTVDRLRRERFVAVCRAPAVPSAPPRCAQRAPP